MTRADGVVILLAMALLPYLYLTYWGDGTRAERARILVAGKEFTSISLAKDQRLTIAGILGPSVLEVRGGKIRFINAPCRNKNCIHSGWLAVDGDFSACLPNRISVQLIGRAPRFDAINF